MAFHPVAIIHAELYTPTRRIEDGTVVFAEGRILAVGPSREVRLPRRAERIDAHGRPVTPGLIDLHLHGVEGYDLFGEELAEAAQRLPRHGVTAFVPTTLTLPEEEILRRLQAMARVMETAPPGARILGIHIEGPHLSPKRPGMANPTWFRPLTPEAIARYQAAAGGRIRLWTFAPEEGEAMQAIPALVAQGIIPVIGHSDATYDQATEAIQRGVRQVTHFFNAMRPFHHREPGLFTAALLDPRVIVQLIADGQHVHPAAMRLLFQVKGSSRVAMISDAAPMAGLPPGRYTWLGYEVIVADGRCQTPEGALAGSVALMNEGLRVLIEEVGIDPLHAVRSATWTPAQALGLRKFGRLRPGAPADLVLWARWGVPEAVWVGGERMV
ncbi:N-acetylglucosamine-6-phosphate deacetylase [Thermoflexus sp.]|uniref:N-acetylglucosamine-6-phosphate deacetylase n=1 Tax=Thermoflexus sp. TaxID=1969742 RepID=UPI002ADE854A|nr:N-acetylglucosamine-6-phosphate deacetylase [Thermoflexus sp.]